MREVHRFIADSVFFSDRHEEILNVCVAQAGTHRPEDRD